MKQHTVKSYDKDLLYLDNLIGKAGKLVLEMFRLHSLSLEKKDSKISEQIHTIDIEVNAIDRSIEEQAIVMLATRQPLAIDLRHILSSIRFAGVLERMGDLSKHIVDRSSKVKKNTISQVVVDLQRMNDLVRSMLHRVLQAYKSMDVNEALSIIEEDKNIDILYGNVIDKLAVVEENNKDNISSLMQLTICIKNIERLGDYATKLAKLIYYIARGENVSDG